MSSSRARSQAIDCIETQFRKGAGHAPRAAAARLATRDRGAACYQRHRPEQTLLYRIVDEYSPAFMAHLAEQGSELRGYVQREFEDYLKCGRLDHGFLRVRCESCHAEHLVAFSCKRRGFCPSCGARRMAESAVLLVDEVLPEQPMRQWVLSFLCMANCKLLPDSELLASLLVPGGHLPYSTLS